MPRVHRFLIFGFAVFLTACRAPQTPISAPTSTPTPTSSPLIWPITITPEVSTAVGGIGYVGTPQVITAVAITVNPQTTFVYPTPGPIPTSTPIPPIAGGLGPTELKYRVLAEFPQFFFCDPDFYPIAR